MVIIMQKHADTVVKYMFFCLLLAGAVGILCLPKETYTKAERRKLAKFPKFTIESVLKEDYMSDLETYLLDHFPGREQLRRIKALFAYDILQQKENNDIYVVGNVAAKLEYPLNQASVEKAAEKMQKLQEMYFPESKIGEGKVYYTIVPDKNYFLAEQNGYPTMDYDMLVNMIQEKLTDMSYIDIMDTLSIEDYYRTDTHWRQEQIFDTAQKIAEQMGHDVLLQGELQEISDFYGVYYGQSALPLPAEKLYYLENESTKNARVSSFEDKTMSSVYTTNKTDVDKYDVYLGGAQALIHVENPEAKTDARLILFRDSFGSSLAPLLLEAYREVILIDTRYIKPELLADYVDFETNMENTQILFLYNTLLLNNSSMLR